MCHIWSDIVVLSGDGSPENIFPLQVREESGGRQHGNRNNYGKRKDLSELRHAYAGGAAVRHQRGRQQE